jgi:REP element-mobilizing transposase RayT
MRLARIKLEGQAAVYHCISRIVGGQFLLGDQEKEKMRELIWKQARFCGLEVVSYCVMSNHFHVLVRAPASQNVSDSELIERAKIFYKKGSRYLHVLEETLKTQRKLPRDLRSGLLERMGDISVYMKELKQRFSKWYNKKEGRFGTLWSERFKSVLIEDLPSVVRMLAAYIDLNPVRAGLVEDPKDYRFCSYHEAVAGEKRARQGIQSFHETGRWKQAAAEYRQYLYVESAESGRSDKKATSREAIRKEVERGGELETGQVLRLKVRYLTDGVALGSKNYVDEIFAEFRDRFGAKRKSGSRKTRGVDLRGLRVLRDLRTAVAL